MDIGVSINATTSPALSASTPPVPPAAEYSISNNSASREATTTIIAHQQQLLPSASDNHDDGNVGGSNSSNPTEVVLVHHHEPSPPIHSLEDVHTAATAPILLNAARTLDIDLERVRKGRRCCAVNLGILMVCLVLQGYSWIAFYHKSICDVYLDGEIEYSLTREINALRKAISDYDASPITSGEWLPASFTITSTKTTAANGRHFQPLAAVTAAATAGSQYYNVTVRNKDRVAIGDNNPYANNNNDDDNETIISVAEFTSHFLQVEIPYSNFVSAVTVDNRVVIQFDFTKSDSVLNFSRQIPLELDTSTLAQPVIENAYCLPQNIDPSSSSTTTPTPTASVCDQSHMADYCAKEYTSDATWEAPASSPSAPFSGCKTYTSCGKCKFNRFLSSFDVVVYPNPNAISSVPPLSGSSSSSPKYIPDPVYASPHWPFNNEYIPNHLYNPREDASSRFVTPSTSATNAFTGTLGAAELNRKTMGRGQFSPAAASASSSASWPYQPTPKPANVLIRIYKKDDPLLVLQRYTQGLNEFATFESRAIFDAQIEKFREARAANPNISPNDIDPPEFTVQTFRLLGRSYPLGCGVPEMFCAWGVFVGMFIFMVVICKRVPNFALEADFSDGIPTEYEDYDRDHSSSDDDDGDGHHCATEEPNNNSVNDTNNNNVSSSNNNNNNNAVGAAGADSAASAEQQPSLEAPINAHGSADGDYTLYFNPRRANEGDNNVAVAGDDDDDDDDHGYKPVSVASSSNEPVNV